MTQKPRYAILAREARINRQAGRRCTGWSMEATAKRCGMKFTSYWRMENGDCTPTYQQAVRIAEVLGIDKDRFLFMCDYCPLDIREILEVDADMRQAVRSHQALRAPQTIWGKVKANFRLSWDIFVSCLKVLFIHGHAKHADANLK